MAMFFYLSTNAMVLNVTATGEHITVAFLQILVSLKFIQRIPVSSDHQSKLTLMSGKFKK